MEKARKTLVIILLVALLILVRAFEDVLFYDPFLNFFRQDYKTMPLPKIDAFALQTGVAIRFLVNTLISLGIIWLIFKDREIIKLAALLYSILFAGLFLVFSFIIFTSEKTGGHFVLFYVRRFLIQPLLLLIFLPAIYFQKYKSR